MTTEYKCTASRKISSQTYTTAAEPCGFCHVTSNAAPLTIVIVSFNERRGATANTYTSCASRVVSPGSIALRCSRIISGLSALHSHGGNFSASLHGSVHKRRAQRARPPCHALVGHGNTRCGRRHPRRRFRRPHQRRGRSTGAGDPGPRPGVQGLGRLHGTFGEHCRCTLFFLLTYVQDR